MTGHFRALRPFAALAAVLVWLASASAQDAPLAAPSALESRVHELEETVRQLQQTLPAPKILDEPKPKKPLAGWDNGFILRSADDQFLLRITGQLQTDYRHYQNDADTTDLPTFLVRRARLGIEGAVLKYYEFRLLPDFGQGNTRLLDAYLNVHYWDAFQFEAGKFKQPFSLEHLIQDRFVPTIERSIIDQLVPARDVGLMFHGQKLFEDRLDFGASVYGGVRDGDQDTDRNKEVAGRVVVRPFRDIGLPDFLEPLQVGVAGTFGEDEGVLQPTTLRTPAFVPWFQFAPGVRPDGLRTRCSPELSYIYGSLAVAAQYYWETQVLRAPAGAAGPAADVELSYRGFYVLCTCLVTGEERTSLSQAIDPISPFDPTHGAYGFGALELVGRLSCLELDSDVPLTRLMDRSRSAPRATELTLGFNWYLNRFVRMQFNWEYARFASPVRLGIGPGGAIDHQNSFLGRIQIVF